MWCGVVSKCGDVCDGACTDVDSEVPTNVEGAKAKEGGICGEF